MESPEISKLFKKYNLTKDDYFKHKHYQIITRSGMDKIQAIEKIFIEYEVIAAVPKYCAVKAKASKDNAKIETFGSAVYGGKEWITFDKPTQQGKTGKWIENGNTNTWYVLEVAEKRAMSRAVLKLTGFYQLGVFGEDESEDFKKETTPPAKTTPTQPVKEPVKQTQPLAQQTTPTPKAIKPLPRLVEKSESWEKMVVLINTGILTSITQVEGKYSLEPVAKAKIIKIIKDYKPKKEAKN
ncbi:hypothetical protein M1M25_gp024 [Tenacibaculum phage Gundel_1]|uniref:Uncharacterized protein n=1 Tax=Tenacibaculum phage Gundel_1 TaxID=2745672 RepID=A0A8E4ZFY5_9CAUD|nr:hypothetical protein M1M25_gp024 [Tenacibaculum phage Gundel_1]QQV91455.1 hypothetical protein Gundel1_24 [Tenacibaculum phage Gundel_1]